MEEYIGKKCPFCKTTIEEGEAVKVCPSCGIPHHESCWIENNGCTTFGCTEQYSGGNAANNCVNCGAPLAVGQAFCTKCGTPVTAPQGNICRQCGAEVAPGNSFCTKCGAPQTNAGAVATPTPSVAPPPVYNAAPAQTPVQNTAPTPPPTPAPTSAPTPAPAPAPAPEPHTVFADEPISAPANEPAPEPTPAPFNVTSVGQTAKPPVAPSAAENNVPPSPETAASVSTPYASQVSGATDTPNTAPAAAAGVPQPRRCTNCGNELQDGQSFCIKCGTPAAASQRRVCGKCGAELSPDQGFCPRCGQKSDLQIDANVNSAISQFNNDLQKNNAKKKKKPLIIAGIAVAAVVTIILAIVLIPKLFVSVDKCLEKGEYEKAYTTAKAESEKSNVVKENAIAVCSAICIDNLKTPSSFDLQDAYYDSEYGWVVLEVLADNGSGEKVLNYWLFSFTKKSNEYSLVDSYSDLDKESYSYYDSLSENKKKVLDNACKMIIKDLRSKADKLSVDGLKRINRLFSEGKLKDAKLISGATYRTKEDSSSSSSYDYDDYDDDYDDYY